MLRVCVCFAYVLDGGNERFHWRRHVTHIWALFNIIVPGVDLNAAVVA